jgi:hypothetical protein
VIRSGDIYALESWQVEVEVVELHGSTLAAPMVARLGGQPDPARMYRVATTAYAAAARQDQLGPIASRQRGPLLRDLTVDHLKQHGFAV